MVVHKKRPCLSGNTAQRKIKTAFLLVSALLLLYGGPVAVSILARTPAGSKSHDASAGLLTRSSSAPSRPVGQWLDAEPFRSLRGAGTHSNGYCCRFSLHSLFILPHRSGRRETFAGANIGIIFESVRLGPKKAARFSGQPCILFVSRCETLHRSGMLRSGRTTGATIPPLRSESRRRRRLRR